MRILIAEDHAELRELLEFSLVDEGHEVISAKDGEEACRIFCHDERGFDYVITDYQMPRKNGLALIIDIRRSKPDQKVVLVSADPPQMTDTLRKAVGDFPVLQKPYDRADLFNLLK